MLAGSAVAVATAAATVGVYWGCKLVYTRWRLSLLQPMLTSFLVIVLALVITHTHYRTYMTGGRYFTAALQPATVAFAVPLYRHFDLFRKHAVAILTGLVSGVFIAVASSVTFAKWLHLGTQIERSVAPRSVTTPIAMDISRNIGGVPVLTAVFVLLTGITGILIGPWLIRRLRLQTSVGKGALMGMGAHGIGTARAFEEGAHEGTIASLSMILAACITLVVAPWFTQLLL